MKSERLDAIQRSLERLTRRWWFFLLFLLLQFVSPYASKGYEWSEVGMVVGEILSYSLVYAFSAVYPIFKLIPIALVIAIVLVGNRVVRAFDVYVAITYVLFAFLQSIAVTENFGLGVEFRNLVMFLIVAAFWFWEAIVRKNDFAPRKIPTWKYWAVPLAFLAFWYPLNPQSMMPDFNPIYLLSNVGGLAFCLMTPVYLTILTLYHPKVNIATLRVTSLVGIIIGLYNVLVNFFFAPSVLWWNGVLHIPLLTISAYGLVLSFE